MSTLELMMAHDATDALIAEHLALHAEVTPEYDPSFAVHPCTRMPRAKYVAYTIDEFLSPDWTIDGVQWAMHPRAIY